MKRYEEYLKRLESSDSLRVLRDTECCGSDIIFNGKTLKNFSSNDYLGIGGNAELWHEFLEIEGRNDFGGSCSSRLLTGNFLSYKKFEENLETLYGRPALVFNSGYHANIGILPALTTSHDLVLADKLVHASIIDGLRLSQADVVRFRHNDTEQLEKVLVERRDNYENVFIVTEAVFSMDGDLAPLAELADIKSRYGAFLYVDEAHSVGVRGTRGLGLAEEVGILKNVDLLVGTLGKAFASQGAFLICNDTFKKYLVNTARPLIFSTALPPVSVGWSNFLLQKITAMTAEREHLKNISDMLRQGIASLGLNTLGDSNVVPIILGSNELAVKLSEKCIERGFFVLPIRTPTVSAGSERVRISLTAAHTITDIEKFLELCKHIGK